MARKIYAEVTMRIIINTDDEVEVSNVIGQLEVTYDGTDADIEACEILNHEVVDSK